MTTKMDLKQLWQDQEAAPPPAYEEVRRAADQFTVTIRRRNRREYIACFVVSLFFAAIALTDGGQVRPVACVLVILGSVFVAWQLHRRAAVVPAPDEAGLPLLDHQRTQLARQRDALASVASWYLLPMMPGLLLFSAAPMIEAGAPYRPSPWDMLQLGVIAAVFAGIWWLNRAAARELQAEIDALPTFENEGYPR